MEVADLFLVLHLWSLPSEAPNAGCALAGWTSQEVTVKWGSLHAQLLPLGKGEKKRTGVSLNSLCRDICIRLSIWYSRQEGHCARSLHFISKTENSRNRQSCTVFTALL